MHLAPSKCTLTEDAHPPFGVGRKLSDIDKALLWQLLHEDPECPTRVLLDKVADMQRAIAVSVRHLNRLRATWQCNRPKGRPRHAACSTADSRVSGTDRQLSGMTTSRCSRMCRSNAPKVSSSRSWS